MDLDKKKLSFGIPVILSKPRYKLVAVIGNQMILYSVTVEELGDKKLSNA